MPVSFSYADRSLPLKNKIKVKQLVIQLFKAELLELGSLSYVFCSDDYLLNINRSFLHHDYYTDIITFDLSEPFSKLVSGEIYVSVDRVKENATLNNVSFFDEMLRVVLHGALHLCGYKDKTKREIKVMREREDHYLRLFGKLFA